MPCEKNCYTCHYYDNGSGYDCEYWEYCTDTHTCTEWKEGKSNENLLYRIRKLEGE